jgi:hypothetical protein
MARVRLTYFFELGDTGWSESVHTTLPPTSVPAIQALVGQYTAMRLPCLSNEAQLTHVRVSDDDTFRDILFLATGLPASGTYSKPPAGPWTGLLITLVATPTLRRSLFMRGIPKQIVDGRNPTFDATFTAAINNYLAGMIASPFAISGKTANPSRPITTAVGATGVVTTVGVTGAAVGDTIQVIGVPTSVLPTRFYRVIGVDNVASTVTLAGWPLAVNLTNVGFLRRTTKEVVQISQAVSGLITERKVGRPFGQLRGRARR